ncbi:uncharacterized protein BDR25DRAFT_390829 [Lindgomyces ingoldianus]|uniref:Uncharacterized protein n=1 Tax=Lindgomyces ingoldianus TaxID=673940 RepID=A0ACB6RFQ8_9PLEO|nr:uncharacterized protein BDR25DRAFT_390829 [Lindgomyces ingoldianus]KAF2477306.1 hypothetical protein BDR25DRAFT_390829 [Lindgomyces ingoldianus]
MAKTSDERSSFMHVPLELRNEIYGYLMVDLPPALQVPPHLNESALHFLSRRLPHCLLLNHQVLEEATIAYLGRTLLIISGTGFASLDVLLSRFPNDIAYNSVHRLDFAYPPDRYAQSCESKPPLAPANCVYDFVSRCPGLRHLTMAVLGNMLVTAGMGNQVGRVRTMKEVEERMGFTRVFEHKSLQTLQLVCNDGVEYARKEVDLSSLFQSFAKWFVEESSKRGRKISFHVKICPSNKYNHRNPELGWYTAGHVTSYYYQDFFGIESFRLRPSGTGRQAYSADFAGEHIAEIKGRCTTSS